jgi:hypothetical protein
MLLSCRLLLLLGFLPGRRILLLERGDAIAVTRQQGASETVGVNTGQARRQGQ